MLTLTEVLARHQIAVADELLAEIEVPVLCGPQRQGDVLIVPRPLAGRAELAQMTIVTREGVPVVRGEATGNTHLLDAVTGDVYWQPHTAVDSGEVRLGVLHVADGATAMLIHTDEHGANGIGPGTYILTGKREQAEEIRRVAD